MFRIGSFKHLLEYVGKPILQKQADPSFSFSFPILLLQPSDAVG